MAKEQDTDVPVKRVSAFVDTRPLVLVAADSKALAPRMPLTRRFFGSTRTRRRVSAKKPRMCSLVVPAATPVVA